MIERLNAALEGRYRIERQLGAGGMAFVYLAEDLKHQRKVAIKVLKPELAAVVGAERFLAEIETTANLQHPHILPLFDSGEADGFLFYVMPFVEGESLRDRLDREQELPVEEAVRIASDVAEALHAAHERGVIHRDIKPANILLSGGRPLVADFGIALAVSNAGAGRLTETGLSMGTPYYMSPEQASADRDPTPASDQYSLACVLYEMLVGEPPFPGGSAQAVLARILTGEPTRPSATRKSVPPNVEAVVMRGLEKLPADRFSDAREMVRALRDGGFAHGAVGRDTGVGSHGRRGPGASVPWVLAVTFLGVAAIVWLGTRGSASAEAPPLRLAIPMEDPEVPLGPLLRLGLDADAFDVSSDEAFLVHMGWDGDAVRLYRRSLDSYESTPISGTEGALDPFLSPDDRWIAFFAASGLWKVPVDGGEPIRLANASNPFGGYWTDDDRIWFTSAEGNRFNSVSSDGGETRLELEGQETTTPFALPDGSSFLIAGSDPTRIGVWVPGGSVETLVQGGSPRLTPDGHLTFVRGRTLYAAGFDLESRTLTTAPVPVQEGLRSLGWISAYQFSRDGTLFYIPGENAQVVVPVLVDAEGRADTLPIPPAAYGHLAISPQLDRIATYVTSTEFEVTIIDIASGRAQRIDRAPGVSQAIWSRSGDRVAYGRQVDGSSEWELVVRTPGSTAETVVLESELPAFPSDWTIDDRELLYSFATPSLGLQSAIVSLEEGSEPELLLESPADEWGAVLSPDGRWMAYTSDRDGGYDIYVTPYPMVAGTASVKVSAHPGSEEPHWSFDGEAVLYRSGGQWWRVPLRFGPSAIPGEPELIAEGAFINVRGKSWDLLPDGRLLMGDGPRDATVDRIHMIPNFAAEIDRRVREAGR